MINISTYSLRVVKESGGRYDIDSKIISQPKDTVRIFNEVLELDTRTEEVFAIMTLDTKNKVTGIFTVSIGAINSAVVHPREVYKRALLQNAAVIIACHNHPSGDPSPSKEDINITLRLKEVGKIIGIELLDHIIIGSNDDYISFKNKGII